MKKNIAAYFISMRWYCGFIPAMAGLLGMYLIVPEPNLLRQMAILIIMFAGWGVNQVVNDYLSLTEDRINAPSRAMVTGTLQVKHAIAISAILFIIGAIATYFLNGYAVVVYVLIFAMNFAYSRFKKIILGNAVYGLLIALCVYYGALCAGSSGFAIIWRQDLAAAAILVWFVNFIFCFFSNFKDAEGDKAAGIRNLVILLTPNRAKYLSLPFVAILFTLVRFFLLKESLFLAPYSQDIFYGLITLSALIFVYTAISLIINPRDNAYHILKWAIIATACFEAALIGLVSPCTAMFLFIFNLIAINLLFVVYDA
ncbi:MAG: UbiA family prenyltransferase [Candidatus Omnitrophica bacterium]|nr:UbiA family prenyltransferase [Candidatus Omnitrophota bacterium]